MRIYVAGPYTKGDVGVNVRNAIVAAQELLVAGHAPYVPHLTHFWHLVEPGPYKQWLALDLKWLAVCDALVRLPGDSNGADLEMKQARKLGIRVYLGVKEFLETIGSVR